MPRVRALPWLALAEAAYVAKRHWDRLDADDRAELAALVRKSRGRKSNLTAREQRRLRALVKELDLAGAGREILPIGRRARRR